ncbi:MAG: NmrA family transcriptional regulator [Mesorhizobium amorphae]|nr:MAG: NmrA family transcriptional regulator [Mesorhizobium amorphae]
MDSQMGTGSAPVVIVGGGGKTGRRLAERLAAKGRSFRFASRSTMPSFDWTDRSTWKDALGGAGSLYLSYQPDLGLPGGAEAVDALSRLASEMGIKRVVLLSGRGEQGAERAEQALMAAVPEWTILRCSWFNQNFSESFLTDGVMSGEIVLPAGDVAEPFVDADDIADVAAVVLTERGHERQLYELTGPRALIFAEIADLFSHHLERPVRFTQVPLEPFLDELRAQSLPDEIIALMRMLFDEVLDGRNSGIADGVERVLGRPPRDFQSYIAGASAAGSWRPAA